MLKKRKSEQQVENYFLGIGSTKIEGKGSVKIHVQPQIGFKPQALLIPASIAKNFLITDIKVDKISQFMSTGCIPAEIFNGSTKLPIMKMDPVAMSSTLTIEVYNQSEDPLFFQACFIGPPLK